MGDDSEEGSSPACGEPFDSRVADRSLIVKPQGELKRGGQRRNRDGGRSG